MCPVLSKWFVCSLQMSITGLSANHHMLTSTHAVHDHTQLLNDSRFGQSHLGRFAIRGPRPAQM